METCPLGKSCYQTWAQATHRATAMNRYRTNGGESFMAYKCRGRGHYHVGGRNTREERAKRRNRR